MSKWSIKSTSVCQHKPYTANLVTSVKNPYPWLYTWNGIPTFKKWYTRNIELLPLQGILNCCCRQKDLKKKKKRKTSPASETEGRAFLPNDHLVAILSARVCSNLRHNVSRAAFPERQNKRLGGEAGSALAAKSVVSL